MLFIPSVIAFVQTYTFYERRLAITKSRKSLTQESMEIPGRFKVLLLLAGILDRVKPSSTCIQMTIIDFVYGVATTSVSDGRKYDKAAVGVQLSPCCSTSKTRVTAVGGREVVPRRKYLQVRLRRSPSTF